MSSILTKAVNPIEMEHQLDIPKTPRLYFKSLLHQLTIHIYLKIVNSFAAVKEVGSKK